MGRLNSDDLRGAEILGANHAASQRRAICERHILGPYPKRELALGTILEQFRHVDGGGINPDAAITAQ